MFDDLFTSLKQLWFDKRRLLNSKYRRTLPFSEYIVDRWEKAKELGFESEVSVYDSSYIFGDVTVGKSTWIGPFTILDGSGGQLSIGSYCSISAGVQIYTHDTVKWATSGGKEGYERAATSIGDHCYIGPYTVIAKGVTVGDRCVIGAHSLVLQDIPAGSRAHGAPCRIVGAV
ncbi:acyltransferase [Hahella sp. KA22]|uniref:acyltransferase n=1 Tax=Hahella sp. KA22 TaxID=1628392 RepID=UPI000FDED68C|nr:acyltransferase [Hahella sp. KA22]AZZ91665.1 acyltransferase [Hahella sp. KA22]QAY55035.1 acyltransferase [Hahella sp. KA22]